MVTVNDDNYKPGASRCESAYPKCALPVVLVSDHSFHLVYPEGATAVKRKAVGTGAQTSRTMRWMVPRRIANELRRANQD